MCGVPRSFMTALCTLAVLFLSLQRCVAKIVYAEKDSPVELPCPCPHCPEQHREMNWYFDLEGIATPLFRKGQHNSVERLPAAWPRLEMLANYSLHLSSVMDSDTGRYWCEQSNYYDLVVVTGTKQTVESRRADSVCYILSCSVSVENIQHSVVRWWEGKKELQGEEKKGGVSVFKGERTSQLHICVKKETAEEGTRPKERRVKCAFADHLGIAFNLTGSSSGPRHCIHSRYHDGGGVAKDCLLMCPNTTRCLESGGHGGTWIPLAACVTLQLVIILALGLALWRRRHCREKREEYFNKGGRDVSKPKQRPQLYENIKTRSGMAQQEKNSASH
ncbi:PREDICTED: lymphocyte antigen 6 complex locus protein G6f [Gekko japonicus]|uniref:Lymphocyte antigen 6 complex locus protein G6f n=1 Tax=Gekko japonicus TaxID=146911 RepID=A0ABM1KQS3_GEKJA|nr:PREDICTED: lymphocyte antigen 6 complex locus protein G6f [Gekko japonicus]